MSMRVTICIHFFDYFPIYSAQFQYADNNINILLKMQFTTLSKLSLIAAYFFTKLISNNIYISINNQFISRLPRQAISNLPLKGLENYVVYIYICIYIYIYVCIHTYIHVNTHTHTHTYIYFFCTHMYTHIRPRAHTHTKLVYEWVNSFGTECPNTNMRPKKASSIDNRNSWWTRLCNTTWQPLHALIWAAND